MSARSYLSIGDVLTLLRQEFPDVTISKIRFLESQGLVNPERTPSGYRKFYEHDVERLRWVLRQQREHFLPLKVIKGRLDDPKVGVEASRSGAGSPDVVDEPSPRPQVASGSVDAASDVELVADEVSSGAKHHAPVLVGQAAHGAESAGAGASNGSPLMDGSRESDVGVGLVLGPQESASQHATAMSHASTNHDSANHDSTNHDSTTGVPSASTQPASNPRPSADGREPRATSPAMSVSTVRGSGDAGETLSSGAAASSADGFPPASKPAPGDTPRTERSSAAVPGAAGTDEADTRVASAKQHTSGISDASPSAASAPPPPAPTHGTSPASAPPESPTPVQPGATSTTPSLADAASVLAGGAGASLTLEELVAASGIDADGIAELRSYGLLRATTAAGTEYFDEEALTVATVAARFASFGVEPRHLRLYKNAADREAGFIEQVVTPIVRLRNPDARARASQTSDELTRIGNQLRASLLRSALRDLLNG